MVNNLYKFLCKYLAFTQTVLNVKQIYTEPVLNS